MTGPNGETTNCPARRSRNQNRIRTEPHNSQKGTKNHNGQKHVFVPVRDFLWPRRFFRKRNHGILSPAYNRNQTERVPKKNANHGSTLMSTDKISISTNPCASVLIRGSLSSGEILRKKQNIQTVVARSRNHADHRLA